LGKTRGQFGAKIEERMDPSLTRLIGRRRVVLASRSPRRKEILEKELGLKNVTVFPSGFAEDLDKFKLAPFEYVLETAQEKVLDVYKAEVDADDPPAVVIGADTIVVNGSIILEKPLGVDHHISMLKSLRDNPLPHKVFTAVACIVPYDIPAHPGYAMETHLEETEVYFKNDITDEEILEYVRTGEGSDAAGGYKIQEIGKKLVEKIEGDYFNVVGLPAAATAKLIKKTINMAKSPSDVDTDSNYDEDDF
jgi:septum formation protein